MTHSQTMSDGMVEITQADRDAAEQYDVVEAFARHREAAAAEERAKIVAWLRGSADWHEKHDDGLSGFDRIAQADRESADAIEAGSI